MEQRSDYFKIKEEYNDVPVEYCSQCLSLGIIDIDEDNCYCVSCGSTKEPLMCHFEEWLELVKD